jgi:K+-sensing histidine kinase KdpD
MLNDVLNPFLQAGEQEQPGASRAVGLGLLACRTIARQHGAQLSAQNNEGPGCTFCLRWPAA